MRIVSFDELTDDDINNSFNFTCINMQNEKVFALVSALDESDCDDIVNILNAINGQGITKIDKNAFFYSIKENDKEVKLPFLKMSTSESVFFICALADKTQTSVILSKDISQLTRHTMKIFYHLFKDSNYIILAFEDEYEAGYYRNVLLGGRL